MVADKCPNSKSTYVPVKHSVLIDSLFNFESTSALVGTFNKEKGLWMFVDSSSPQWRLWPLPRVTSLPIVTIDIVPELCSQPRHTPFNTSSREIESLSAENVLGGGMIDWKLGLFIEMRCIVRMLRAVKISDIFLAIKGQYKKYNQFMAKSC